MRSQSNAGDIVAKMILIVVATLIAFAITIAASVGAHSIAIHYGASADAAVIVAYITAFLGLIELALVDTCMWQHL